MYRLMPSFISKSIFVQCAMQHQMQTNVTWSSSRSLSDWRSLVSLASTSVLQASLAVSDISSTYVTYTLYLSHMHTRFFSIQEYVDCWTSIVRYFTNRMHCCHLTCSIKAEAVNDTVKTNLMSKWMVKDKVEVLNLQHCTSISHISDASSFWKYHCSYIMSPYHKSCS